MRATDMLFAIPAILLVWRSSLRSGGLVQQRFGDSYRLYPIFVRVVRGPVLALREAGYVRRAGCWFSPARLLFRHIPPNVAGIVAVQTSLALAWAVLAELPLVSSVWGRRPDRLTGGNGLQFYVAVPRCYRVVDIGRTVTAVVIASSGSISWATVCADAIGPRGGTR